MNITQNSSNIITAISKILDNIISVNINSNVDTHLSYNIVKHTHSKCIPNITVIDYLTRLHLHMNCSIESIIITLIYINRLMLTISHAVININTIHRLILSFLVLAIKYHDDVFYKMDYYATVGGIKVQELHLLEILLFNSINHNLHVTEFEFNEYLSIIEDTIKKYNISQTKNNSTNCNQSHLNNMDNLCYLYPE